MKRASGNARRTCQAYDLHVLCTLLQVTEECSNCTSLPTQHHYDTAREKRGLSSSQMDEALIFEELEQSHGMREAIVTDHNTMYKLLRWSELVT